MDAIVKLIDSKYKYMVKKGYMLKFDVRSLNIPDMKCYSLKDNRLIISVIDGYMYLHEGYSWDGCTGIGKIYETYDTLMASALHDAAYQLAEQKEYKASWFTQHEVDELFICYLPYSLRVAYYAGVRIFGRFYFGDLNPSLNIKFEA